MPQATKMGLLIWMIGGLSGADFLVYTTGFLHILKDQAAQSPLDNNASSTMRALTVPKGPLEQFKTALEQLEAKLRPAHGIKRAERAIT